MSEAKGSTAKYWLYFLISLSVMIAMIIFTPAWFWVALPFPITFFVMALDWM